MIVVTGFKIFCDASKKKFCVIFPSARALEEFLHDIFLDESIVKLSDVIVWESESEEE